MSDWQPRRYKDYEWIVADPELLGGKLAICTPGCQWKLSWNACRTTCPCRI